MNILAEIVNDARAVMLMKDWLGEEMKPVTRESAEQRASICEPCKKNIEPKWWDRFKHAVADVIRDQIAIKNKLDLKLPNDEALGMCQVCGCAAILKPWAPIKHIQDHTPAETLALFPGNCWIPKEIKETHV
jgi:hypothetical protein